MVKFCPLMSWRDGSTQYYCLEDECAWWDEEQECCAIVAEKRVKPITCTDTSATPYFRPPSSIC